jgi:hypothetical protein
MSGRERKKRFLKKQQERNRRSMESRDVSCYIPCMRYFEGSFLFSFVGLLITSMFFVFVNKKCVIERKKVTDYGKTLFLLFMLSPFIYLNLIQILELLAWQLLPALRAGSNPLMEKKAQFLTSIIVFVIPLYPVLKGYSRLVRKPIQLCYFIYSMFWMMHLIAQLIAGVTFWYFPLLFLLTLIWYRIFKQDIFDLAHQASQGSIHKLNLILTLALFSNMVLLVGSRLMPLSGDDKKIAEFWFAMLAISLYIFLLLLFSSLFATDRDKRQLAIKEKENQELTIEARESQAQVAESLAEIIESKSGQTGHHVKRVSEYSRLIASEMGFDPQHLEVIRVASMLHDVGKLMIPGGILDKPGKLTAEEYSEMQKHVFYGGELLKNAPGEIMACACNISKEHHERWDGNGYLSHLKGDQIHLESQIVSVADVFDAITAKRSYHEKRSCDIGKEEIVKGSGTQFSPKVVEAFLACYDQIVEIHDRMGDD